jgi:hypothetical protein
MDSVAEWEPRVLVSCAQGFFKVAIRRHPDAVCWSWALEWNHNYRIVGFFGERAPTELLLKAFPNVTAVKIAQCGNDWVAYQEEVPLADVDDKLFYWEIA